MPPKSKAKTGIKAALQEPPGPLKKRRLDRGKDLQTECEEAAADDEGEPAILSKAAGGTLKAKAKPKAKTTVKATSSKAKAHSHGIGFGLS